MNHIGLNGKESGNSAGNVEPLCTDAPMPDWHQSLRTYKQGGVWNSVILGPPPGQIDCRAPAQLLQYYGYDPDLDIILDAPPSASGNGSVHEADPHEPNEDAKARPKSSTDWPDPCPLPASLLPVDTFSLDLMPEKVRPWVADVTERMQCPPDFVAVTLLAGLGSLIGRKVVIRPQTQNDWQVASNMWALLIGRPGVLKSPAMEEALRPVKRLSAKAEEIFKEARLEHEVLASVAKLRAQENMKKAAKVLNKEPTADISYLLSSEEEAPEPTLRRYIANDTNVASLGVLLQQNPNGLLVFRDELVSLLDNLDQEENASERGFYLTGWAGDSSYTFDRIGRGLHLHIEGVCVSMLGSTQPGRISQYLLRAVRGGRGDDGLIQRFGLLIWPDVSPAWTNVDRWPDKDARADAFTVFEHLERLDWHSIAAKRDRGADGDEEGLPYLRFGLDAYDRFVDWRTELEKRLRSDLHPALESHLSKYRKLVPGLALICHLVDGQTGSVGLAALERALAWAKYLESHARRAYGSVTAFSSATAAAIVAKIRSGDLKSEFRSHEVWRPGWSKLSDREAVNAALNMLLDYDWLRVRVVQTGGRPAYIYMVNPKVLNDLKAC
jgi:putative DNA primase/helicase